MGRLCELQVRPPRLARQCGQSLVVPSRCCATMRLPMGRLTVVVVVAGVSGSGKSTLVSKVFFPEVRKALGLVTEAPGRFDKLTGEKAFERAIAVDQAPIGRTPRSVPATFLGVWDEVRKLFAALPDAKIRGFAAWRFSFNSASGRRCAACDGQGAVVHEMSFLPAVVSPCETCAGLRFESSTGCKVQREVHLATCCACRRGRRRSSSRRFRRSRVLSRCWTSSAWGISGWGRGRIRSRAARTIGAAAATRSSLPQSERRKMYRTAPLHDLSHLNLGPAETEAMYFRWANRALGALVPRALTELGFASDAQAWRALVPFGPAKAGPAYELCRTMRHRIWPSSDAPVSQELAFHVLGTVEGPVGAMAQRSGHIRVVQTTWNEETGPGEVIPWTEAELAEMARLDPISWASVARTIAHTLDGHAGFAAEVKQEYEALTDTGWHGPYQGTEWGHENGGSHLVRGCRYRVYEAFVDCDGQHHPWGESWRFERFVFDPVGCALEIHIAEAALLDSGLKPIQPMPSRAFRLPWSVGDKRGYPKEPLEFIITTA
jgi:hypothetical protein